MQISTELRKKRLLICGSIARLCVGTTGKFVATVSPSAAILIILPTMSVLAKMFNVVLLLIIILK